jgi:cysteinyl-tRNA synthetase
MKKFQLFQMLAAILLTMVSCGEDDESTTNPVYKQRMRDFVQAISVYAKDKQPGFLIIPQNGLEILTQDGNEDGKPVTEYLNAIDGVGREDLFYGYNEDNKATPTEDLNYLLDFLNICSKNKISVLTTDYCWEQNKVNDSYTKNQKHGFISFAAPDRELNTIPGYPETPFLVNDNDINNLEDAKNFLYLLNNENYSSKSKFIAALGNTNYDAMIIDLYFNEETLITSDIKALKQKKNGGNRLLIAYMSIGEAEDYRFYWQSDWIVGNPSFLESENPYWKGNYKVMYWEKEWQNIIFGNSNAYLDKILSAGFDGVYLDIIDAFEYFE